MANADHDDLSLRAVRCKARRWIRLHGDGADAALCSRIGVAPGAFESFLSGIDIENQEEMLARLVPLLATELRRPGNDGRMVPLGEEAVRTYEVFVARDFGDSDFEDRLARITERPPPGSRILSIATQGALWKAVAAQIERADRVLAIIDESNANVGFEVGYALAKGIPVALAVKSPERLRKNWGPGRAFEHHLYDTLTSLDKFREIVRGKAEVILPPTPRLGRVVLALCPNTGDAYREKLTESRPEWQIHQADGRDVVALEDRLAECHHVVWIVLPPSDVSLRDGEEGTANAVVAGAALGMGVPLTIIELQRTAQETRSATRRLADVSHAAIAFDSYQKFGGALPLIEAPRPTRTPLNPIHPRTASSGHGVEPDEALRRYRRYFRSVHATLEGWFSGQGIEDIVPIALAERVASRAQAPDREDTSSLSEVPIRHGKTAGREDESEPLHLGREFTLAAAGTGGGRGIPDRGGESGFPAGTRVPSLRAVLSLSRRVLQPHFLLLGAPGAGKTTTLRRLAFDLAGEPSGPLALYVHARAFVKSNDPFRIVAAFAASGDGNPPLPGSEEAALAAAVEGEFTRLSQETDRVWLLVDGWDEVHAGRDEALRNLRAFLGRAANTRVVIASREAGVGATSFGRSFSVFELQPLDDPAQRALLRFHFPGDEARADDLHDRLRRIPLLADLAGSPLVLALIADLEKRGTPLPERRTELYDRTIDALLTRDYAASEGAKIAEAATARAILSHLAYRLLMTGDVSWSRKIVESELAEVLANDKTLSQRWNLQHAWSGCGAFLEDLCLRTGLLASAGDLHQPWGFLHRSFGEFLAAEFLSRERESLATKLVKSFDEKRPDDAQERYVTQWGEVLGFLVGLQTTPDRQTALLRSLEPAGGGIAARALADAHHLSLAEVLDRFFTLPEVDGDALVSLLRSRLTSAGFDTFLSQVQDWLKSRRTPRPSRGSSSPGITLEHGGWLLFALDEIAGWTSPYRARNRALLVESFELGAPPEIPSKPIPPNGSTLRFKMGSPPRVGSDTERPQRTIELSPFALGTATVTWAQYRAFDPPRAIPPNQSDEFPATEVSWWEAYFFSRCVGGQLPTEAQWEAACRAGSETRFEFGDDERDLVENGWYFRNSGRTVLPVETSWDFGKAFGEWECRPHAVGSSSKVGHRWGLKDMHGNVWEWCHDPFGPYAPSPPGRVLRDPVSEARGRDRVLRGGCYWFVADWCRSAARSGSVPGGRGGWIGFRVAFPAPPSS